MRSSPPLHLEPVDAPLRSARSEFLRRREEPRVAVGPLRELVLAVLAVLRHHEVEVFGLIGRNQGPSRERFCSRPPLGGEGAFLIPPPAEADPS